MELHPTDSHHKIRALPVSSPSKPHAIIVDDEQSYLDLLAVILGEHLDCPVATFARPLDALRAIETLKVGIIVTDYYMPEIDGVEFLRRAGRLKPGVPAIMITGHADAVTQSQRNELADLKMVLAKPFGAQVLANTIQRYWPAAVRA